MEKEKASLKSEISGFILFFCGLVIALSYISFNYHSSLFFIKNPAPPSNLIGYAGNVLASAGFYLFGIGCYFIPAVLFFIAVNMMRSRKILPLLNQIILITAIFFFSAVWLDNFFYHKPARGDIIIHKGMKFEVQGCKNLKISILYGGQKAYIPWNNEIKIYSKRPFRLTGLYPRFVHKIFLSLGRTGSLLTETFLLILFLTVLFRFSLYNFFSGAKLFIFNFLKNFYSCIL
ncbi:MAG TPA: hypothetical protein DC049_09880 [Spirochaetia bacterium]|nr:hypothetical protein [Spirochaetia bacterium]